MSKYDDLSIFISLILRHKPEAIHITLDKHGWANVEELLKGINKTGRKIDIEILEKIVSTDKKQRYSFNKDKTLIRANQGHSISVDVGLKEKQPPDLLFHGTSEENIDVLKEHGIKSMKRLYVHLSEDVETATKVGKRHGNPVVFVVLSKEMYEDGIKFYQSVNGVWLTEFVNPKYLKEVK